MAAAAAAVMTTSCRSYWRSRRRVVCCVRSGIHNSASTWAGSSVLVFRPKAARVGLALELHHRTFVLSVLRKRSALRPTLARLSREKVGAESPERLSCVQKMIYSALFLWNGTVQAGLDGSSDSTAGGAAGRWERTACFVASSSASFT